MSRTRPSSSSRTCASEGAVSAAGDGADNEFSFPSGANPVIPDAGPRAFHLDDLEVAWATLQAGAECLADGLLDRPEAGEHLVAVLPGGDLRGHELLLGVGGDESLELGRAALDDLDVD